VGNVGELNKDVPQSGSEGERLSKLSDTVFKSSQLLARVEAQESF